MLRYSLPIRATLVTGEVHFGGPSAVRNLGNQGGTDDHGIQRFWPVYDYIAGYGGTLAVVTDIGSLLGYRIVNSTSQGIFSLMKPNTRTPSFEELTRRYLSTGNPLELVIRALDSTQGVLMVDRPPLRETETDHTAVSGNVVIAGNDNKFSYIQQPTFLTANNWDGVPYKYANYRIATTGSMAYSNKSWNGSLNLGGSFARLNLNSYHDKAREYAPYTRSYSYSGYNMIQKIVPQVEVGYKEDTYYVKYEHITNIRHQSGATYYNEYDIEIQYSVYAPVGTKPPEQVTNVPILPCKVQTTYFVNHKVAKLNGVDTQPQGEFQKTVITSSVISPSATAIVFGPSDPPQIDKILGNYQVISDTMCHDSIINYGQYLMEKLKRDVNRGVAVAAATAATEAINPLKTDVVESLAELDSTIDLLSKKPDVVEALFTDPAYKELRRVADGLGYKDLTKMDSDDLAHVWKASASRRVLNDLQLQGRDNAVTRRLKAISQSSASTYLAGVFGLLPLIQLGVEVPYIASIISSLGRFAQRSENRGKVELNSAAITSWDREIFKDITCIVRAKVGWSVNAGSISSAVFPLAQLGLTHPLGTLWNLVPLSWLFDIFDRRINNQMKVWDASLSQAFISADYYTYTYKTEMYLSNTVLTKLGWIPTSTSVGAAPRLTFFARRISLGAPVWDGILPSLKQTSISLGQLSTVGAYLTVI